MKTTRRIFNLLFILSGLILLNFTCNDCEEEIYDSSDFSVTLNSTQNTFIIGDTLSLHTIFDSQMELENSGATYDNSDQRINFDVKIFKAHPADNHIIGGRDNFEIIGQIGDVFIPSSRKWRVNIKNICSEDVCELELGLIPQRIGYYGISLQSGRFGTEDVCQNLTLSPTEIESNGNNNFEIFREIHLRSIRVDGSFFRNPETEELLYFFKVTR